MPASEDANRTFLGDVDDLIFRSVADATLQRVRLDPEEMQAYLQMRVLQEVAQGGPIMHYWQSLRNSVDAVARTYAEADPGDLQLAYRLHATLKAFYGFMSWLESFGRTRDEGDDEGDPMNPDEEQFDA